VRQICPYEHNLVGRNIYMNRGSNPNFLIYSLNLNGEILATELLNKKKSETNPKITVF
jgi:hypothetical protein